MRNLHAHDYENVDLEIVWNTLLEDIPMLRESLKNYCSISAGGYDFMKIEQLSTKEVIKLYSASIKELKHRKITRTNNVIGDMGEYLAIS